ncbi:MAG: patatin-like phospholipase family protein [Clostridiaceae bacterium]|nr:patatin-like phospholipase family protein [Clostridiaceae bacterium]
MLGLTLEGGGAKGAYQIGAWRAFHQLNVEFQGITGTSVGALNGALMLQEDFDTAYEIWHNITPNTVMEIDDRIYEMLSQNQLNVNNIHIMFDEVRRFIKGFGFDTKPLEKLIRETVKEDKIRRSNKDFGFVTVSLTDFKPLEIFKEEVPEGKIADYLMASSYLPIFKSKKLDGKKFLDGSFYNNLPIDMLCNRGYKKILVVRLFGRGRVKKINDKNLEVIYIQPHEDLGSIIDFTPQRAQHNMKLGYFDTIRVLKGFKGKKYYIEEDIKEDAALKFLMSFEEEATRELAMLYHLPMVKGYNRLLLEDIIPKWIALMELEEDCNYSDVVVALVEAMASYNKIDPFTIYRLNNLLEDSMVNYNRINRKNDSKNIGFILKTEFFLRLNRERLLEETVGILLKHHQYLSL